MIFVNNYSFFISAVDKPYNIGQSDYFDVREYNILDYAVVLDANVAVIAVY